MTLETLQVAQATADTFLMVGVATAVACVLGLPLGFLVVVTSPGHLMPVPWLWRLTSGVINILRSIPFIILVILLMPVTRALVGSSIGLKAAMVPLAFGAVPFYARLVEMSLREVDAGKVQMGRAFGATHLQIMRDVLLPEAKPGIAAGVAMTAVALVGYSAMAGAMGGGGLGDLAIRYGYQRFQTDVMVLTTLLMIGIVQLFQTVGDGVVRRIAHRRAASA